MTEAATIQRAPNVVFQNLDGEDGAVLLHIDTGAYHGLNPVGARIWELLEAPRTEEELALEIAQEFEGPTEAVTRDVKEFLGDLARRRLVLLDGAR